LAGFLFKSVNRIKVRLKSNKINTVHEDLLTVALISRPVRVKYKKHGRVREAEETVNVLNIIWRHRAALYLRHTAVIRDVRHEHECS
jgi:hypothetical protein